MFSSLLHAQVVKETVFVTAPGINDVGKFAYVWLRPKPKPTSYTSGRAYIGQELDVLERSGAYIKVKTGPLIAWVKAEQVSGNNPFVNASVIQLKTSENETVKLWRRQKQELDDWKAVLKEAVNGEFIQLLQVPNENWALVRTESGISGWVESRFLNNLGEAGYRDGTADKNSSRSAEQAALGRYGAALFSLDCEEAKRIRLKSNVGSLFRERVCMRKSNNAKYLTALRDFKCEIADQIRKKSRVGELHEVQKCRKDSKLQVDLVAFEEAVAVGDCNTAAQLGRAIGKREAGADCTVSTVLRSQNPRRIYLAAAKFDSENDRSRAKKLYTEVMVSFPENDLAINAANRLTQLNDLEIVEQNQAQSAAALKAAQVALQKANADKAVAERKAARALEQARQQAKQAREQAEKAQLEADARAREAEARADSQPRRNSSCDHVSPGMYFEFNGGGLFGIANGRWEVIGINRQGGIVTARKTGQDFRRQISCGQVQ